MSIFQGTFLVHTQLCSCFIVFSVPQIDIGYHMPILSSVDISTLKMS
uniref:Uncharacterized protein n=1 Tax=Anguilla anguilla TaxID=7936 RepID=A0A0E9XLN6_ANGAN